MPGRPIHAPVDTRLSLKSSRLKRDNTGVGFDRERPSGSHVSGVDAHACAPVAIGLRNDFTRLDLTAAAPEDVRVTHGDAAILEMLVDRSFVRENQLLLAAVRHTHNVDVAKFGTCFAPIGVRHDVMPPYFAPGFNLAPRRHRP